MHPHGHNPYTYYGEQTDQGYLPHTRPQEATYWSQEMYSSPGTPSTHSWSMDSHSAHAPQYPTGHTQWGAPGATAQGMSSHYMPNHQYHSASSAPPSQPSHWQPAEPVVTHHYERLPSADKEVVDRWLEKDSDKRVYRCRGDGCGKEFSSKDNARVHVHGKHLGQNKLFRCVQCRTEFASEDGAKRHRDTATAKTFSCPYCSNTYARKDYRDLHQKKCTSRRAY